MESYCSGKGVKKQNKSNIQILTITSMSTPMLSHSTPLIYTDISRAHIVCRVYYAMRCKELEILMIQATRTQLFIAGAVK